MFDFSLEAGDYAPDNFPRSPYASSSYINEVGYDDFFGISNLKYFDIDWQILVESIGFFYRGGIIPCYDEVCQAFPIYEHDILVGMNNNLFVNDNFIKVDLLYHSNTKQLQIINSNEIFQINIFSMLGVKVLDKKFSKKLDVSKLKQGVYIYSLTKNNSVKTGKILVY